MSQHRRFAWKASALVLAGALLGVWSCGDYATMPSPGEGGGPSGNSPRLIPRDSLRVTQTHPGTGVERCTDLPKANYVAQGAEAYICIPVDFHSDGIKEIAITSVQSQSDPVSGVDMVGYAFAELVIPGLGDSPLRERRVFVAKLSPTQNQAASEATLSVVLTSTNESQATYSTVVDIRSIPSAEILEPTDGAVFHPGDQVDIYIKVAGTLGVEKVELEWLGLLKGALPLALGYPALNDTVRHALPLPSPLDEGEITIRARPVDPKGIKGDWDTHIIKVQPEPRDSTAPVPTYEATLDSVLERGSSIVVGAKDEDSGVAKLGYVLLVPGTEQIAWSDSILVNPPSSTSSYSFTVDLPSDFAYGEYDLVIYAEDAEGNRGYFGRSSSVPTLQDAERRSVAVVQGIMVSHAAAAWLRDVAYHPATRTLYFTNQVADRVDVFDVDAREFTSSIRVGSQPTYMTFVPNASGEPSTTLLISNSGGTDISVVDIDDASEIGRRLDVPPFYVGDAGLPNELPLPEDSITWYPLSSRPDRIAAGCADPSCSTTRIYLTNHQSGTTSYSGTRVLILDSNHNIISSDLVLLSYPAGVINPDRSDTRRLIVRNNILDPSNVRQDPDGSVSGTIYRRPPVIAVDSYGDSPLFIADSQGSCFGTAQTCAASRILKVDPSNPWDLTAVASHDYLRNHGEPVRDMHSNSDGSMLAVLTTSGIALLDGELVLKGTLSLSGSDGVAPASMSFLYGHDINTLRAENGGLIAVAHGSSPYIDVYDTYNFDLLKRFRIAGLVTGPMHFQRTSDNGDLAIFATTHDGVVVLDTSTAELIP